MAQKTGADAIYKYVKLICGVIQRYRTKVLTFIAAAETAGIISAGEAATATAFITGADAVCTIFQKLADYNSL